MAYPSKRKGVEAHHCKDGKTLKDLLIELHLGKSMSLGDIADHLSIEEDKENNVEAISLSKMTISNWLEFYDIPTRDNVPVAAVDSIQKSVVDESKGDPQGTGVAIKDFDPEIVGFKCSDQCPHFDICKYQEVSVGNLCPVSSGKKNKFVNPIKDIIADRYADNEVMKEHYSNLAELAGSTWEVLQRKLSYIQSEDVTQILNRPYSVTGELKQVKVSNLLNGEIQKDQGTLVKLLELLKVTPKTADEKDGNDDLLASMMKAAEEAQVSRKKQQEQIDSEDGKKKQRKDIKTHDDFTKAVEEMAEKGGVPEEEIEGALSMEDMMDKNNQEDK